MISPACSVRALDQAYAHGWRLQRLLLVQHNVQGVQVHDATLAASMYLQRIGELLTMNVRDFRRSTIFG